MSYVTPAVSLPASSAMTSFHVVDAARRKVISDVLATPVIAKTCWPIWQPALAKLTGPTPTAIQIFDLAEHLSPIFRLTGTAGREQGSLSGGGNAWEGLVCWYLNLCLIGTNSVVFKKRSSVPPPVSKALTITYGNVAANTESDLVCITFPEDIPELIEPLHGRETVESRLEDVADKYFDDLRVGVIQCKTNWNDNAQIPMMWDMLYNSKEFHNPSIVVGKTYHIDHSRFAYAFATVPTNDLSNFKTTSLSVKRVEQLSGGNYWGWPGKKGIAQSLSGFFAKARMGPSLGHGVRSSLTNALPRLRTDYAYFGL